MDFKAVITAVLNKGNVEQEIESLVKPRNLDITAGLTGGQNGKLSAAAKRNIQKSVNTQTKYVNSAITKAQKNNSAPTNGFFTTNQYKFKKSDIKKLTSEYGSQDKVVEQIAKEQNATHTNARKALNKQIRDQENEAKRQQREAEKAKKDAAKKAKQQADRSSTISSNVDNKSYEAQLVQQRNRLSNYYNDGSKEYSNASKSLKQYESDFKELQKRQAAYKLNPSSGNQNALIQQNQKLSQSYKTLTNDMKILGNTQSKVLTGGQNLTQANRIRTYLEQNSKAAKKYGAQLEDLASQAEQSKTRGDLNDNKLKFNTLKSQISSEGLAGNSAFSEAKRAFGQIGQFVSVYGLLQSGMNKATEMVQNTYDVDDAMTQLQMATGVSNDKAKDLMKTYSQMGHQLKATGTDVAASSTEWMKQGQSVEQSNKLAESSIKLSKVGGISAEDATKYLTSARKGYGITSAEDTLKIVDKLSAVDMASATDVGGLAEGMSEVANTARLAGVDMSKLLSYLATIGEVTQEGMSSVGTELNAVFSRMGNIKLARLKDYQNSGEDLSDVETVLKGEGVSLRDNTDTFRNFGDVLDEVAGKWDSYSSVSKKAIAKAMAGTNHMNGFLTLMDNYKKATEYEKVANDSTGSTDEKYKVYENSLQGKTEDLKNSFQSLSTTLADKNLIGVGVSGLTEVLNVVNKLISSFGLLKAAVAGFVGFKLFKNLG